MAGDIESFQQSEDDKLAQLKSVIASLKRKNNLARLPIFYPNGCDSIKSRSEFDILFEELDRNPNVICFEARRREAEAIKTYKALKDNPEWQEFMRRFGNLSNESTGDDS